MLTGLDHQRQFCLSQMEQELLEEVDREEQLPQLFSSKVTLVGLQKSVLVIFPGADDIQTILPSPYSRWCAPGTEAVGLFWRSQSGKTKKEAASAEISKQLPGSAAAWLSQFRSASNIFLLAVCTGVVWLMVKAISKRFDKHSESLHQMDYNESFFFLTTHLCSNWISTVCGCAIW